ncbi:unnamed protein product [Fusarium venenatum]|uniref:TRP C-terminal domain-containing protein n=1 Tax=Fusarium venenatum TaxID=56646 RepID=A0A2L2SUY6_9HYPO|nr:uncharacterized protein FVRRES_05778 [Fusarium venenatum]CEI61342.1 unnamed protein product [Fusarium venenatum]
MAFVAISSWQSHPDDFGSSYGIDRSLLSAGQGPLWATVFQVTGFLRHLQFILLSTSITIEYPGFFIPVTNKVAWASLLFWKGPLHHGHSSPGIDGGMYVSNATYGLDFVTVTLGYPNMLNTLWNSLFNLAMLLVLAFVIFLSLIWYLSERQTSSPSLSSIMTKAVGVTANIALCFFSVPLLLFMAYDLVLVGYLPNYRIGLAVLMMLIIIGANSFFATRINRRSIHHPFLAPEQPQMDDNAITYKQAWGYVRRHFSHSLPFFQAIFIGALQDYPMAQIFALVITECISSVELALQNGLQFYTTTSTYFSVVRLLAALSSFVFILSESQAMKQWAGYIVLGLHGAVILPGFALRAVYQLLPCISRRKLGNSDGLQADENDQELAIIPVSY